MNTPAVVIYAVIARWCGDESLVCAFTTKALANDFRQRCENADKEYQRATDAEKPLILHNHPAMQFGQAYSFEQRWSVEQSALFSEQPEFNIGHDKS